MPSLVMGLTAMRHVGPSAKPILRHRVVLNFQAEAEGIRADDLVARLLT